MASSLGSVDFSNMATSGGTGLTGSKRTGGSFLGGSGSSGSGTLQSSQQTQAKQQTATKQLEQAVFGEQSTETGRSTTQTQIDRMDPASRAAFNQLISQLSGGGTLAQQEQQQIFMDTLRQLSQSFQSYSPEAATQLAQGNVAGLTRDLMERIMPQITGAQEAAGLSGDALTALLSQDAAARTAEAQQRAILESIMGLGGLQAQTGQQLITGATAQNPIVSSLLQALEIGKGSFESGFSSTLNNILKSTSGFSNKVNEGLSNTLSQGTQNTFGNSSQNNMLAMALAQSMLPPGMSLAEVGGSGNVSMDKNRRAQIDTALNMVGLL